MSDLSAELFAAVAVWLGGGTSCHRFPRWLFNLAVGLRRCSADLTPLLISLHSGGRPEPRSSQVPDRKFEPLKGSFEVVL